MMRLEEQLAHLDDTLLRTVTTQFPDPLTAPEKAQVHAYLVLSHAVLEEHLELAIEKHFDRLSSWLIGDIVPLECVRLAFAASKYVSKEGVSYKNRNTSQLIRNVGKRELVERLRKNHGLKSSNIQSMCELIGLHWPDLEDALNAELNDLDTLGAKRGAAGHLSPYTEQATAIATTDGPDDVRRWVGNGRLGVQAIVAYLDELLRAQQPNSLISDLDGN